MWGRDHEPDRHGVAASVFRDARPARDISVLHTWGSALAYHPHVHMIVPSDGISLACNFGSDWGLQSSHQCRPFDPDGIISSGPSTHAAFRAGAPHAPGRRGGSTRWRRRSRDRRDAAQSRKEALGEPVRVDLEEFALRVAIVENTVLAQSAEQASVQLIAGVEIVVVVSGNVEKGEAVGAHLRDGRENVIAGEGDVLYARAEKFVQELRRLRSRRRRAVQHEADGFARVRNRWLCTSPAGSTMSSCGKRFRSKMDS